MKGIVLRDGGIQVPRIAKAGGIPILQSGGWDIPWPQAVFISQGINVPWDLLEFGFDFLATWEVAAPIWRYDTLASEIARGEDRKRTEALIHDLRVMLYAHELLFVRDCDNARALLETWQRELAAVPLGDVRLAFLRALYIVKPFVLALPNSWLADPATSRHNKRDFARMGQVPLVRVEMGPGRFVRCRQGDEEKVKAEFAQRAQLRGGRRERSARGK